MQPNSRTNRRRKSQSFSYGFAGSSMVLTCAATMRQPEESELRSASFVRPSTRLRPPGERGYGRKIVAVGRDHGTLTLRPHARGDDRASKCLNLRMAVEVFSVAVADREGTVEEKPVERRNVVACQRPVIASEFGLDLLEPRWGSLITIFDCAEASETNAAPAAITVPPARKAPPGIVRSASWQTRSFMPGFLRDFHWSTKSCAQRAGVRRHR